MKVNEAKMGNPIGRRGVSNISLACTLVILAATLVACTYYGSKVYRTHIDTAVNNFAEWTPANVAKYPEEYLNYCETKTNEALKSIKESEVEVNQKIAQLEAKRDETQEKITAAAAALAELTQTCKDAVESKNWPIAWQDTALDYETAKRQVVSLDAAIESRRTLLSKYNAIIGQLHDKANQVVRARDRAKEQLAQIEVNRETLKIQGITDGLKTNLTGLATILDTNPVEPVVTQTHGLTTIDDIVAKQHSTVSDAEFNTILNK